MAITLRIKSRVSGAAGAPATLATGELAYNNIDGKFYVGFGDNGSGVATSVKAFAQDDFTYSLPAGTNGKILGFSGGAPVWQDAPTGGGIYTASGDGIELTGQNFALNYSEIATGIGLANKLDLSGGTLTGKLTTTASATGGAGLTLPHGAAPSAPVNGDVWTTTTDLFVRLNGTTKTIARTDSNITGSAATLTTGRTIALTGDVTYTSGSFNGSANVTGTATIANGVVTLAKMANLAANSFIGNNTGSAATPVALTAAQAKTLLAVSFSDVSGTASTAQIPNLDAAKVTSGVFDVARIPVLPSQTPVVSSGAIANLTAPQQAAIDTGTVVVTTDGRRWVYNTGTKTLEASYVELADITPEWTAIANKPIFATVATSGAYNDLSGKPTLATVATTGAYSDLSGKPALGTMSSQAANAVAITGGTISNVVLDGGTF